jgi:TonB-linked SusC/RagA family outer membrane protein
MKKNDYWRIPIQFGVRRKWLLAMKISVILLLAFNLSLSASVLSQARVALNLKNTSFIELIQELESKTDLGFIYNQNDIKDIDVISLETDDISVEDVLDAALKDSGLEYEIHRDIIIIRPIFAKESPVEKTKQEKVLIQGVVKDTEGLYLPGVTIVVKGTNFGTITNANGEYSLNVPKGNNTLIFSFIGMKTQSVNIDSRKRINVKMENDTESLSEVIVTGYQKISAEKTTGSFEVVSSEQLQVRNTATIQEQLVASVPGLRLVEGKLNLRGKNSFVAFNEPLVIVDGFPVKSLEEVNVNDIESINVLKDAGAASIYGAQAANGVIVIETKMGTSDLKVDVSAKYQYTAIPNYMEGYMNAKQLVEVEKQLYKSEFKSVPSYYSEIPNAFDKIMMDYAKNGPIDFDVAFADPRIKELETRNAFEQSKDEYLRAKKMQEYSISISQNNGKIDFYSSLNYRHKDNEKIGDKSDEINSIIKTRLKVNDKLSLHLNTYFNYSKASNREPVNGAYNPVINPFQNLRDQEGNLILQDRVLPSFQDERIEEGYDDLRYTYRDIYNNTDNSSISNQLKLNFGFNYKLPLDIKWATNFVYETRSYERSRLNKANHPEVKYEYNKYRNMKDNTSLLPEGGVFQSENSNEYSYTLRSQLDYSKVFGDFVFNVFTGMEVRKIKSKLIESKKFGYNEHTLQYVPVNEQLMGVYNGTGLKDWRDRSIGRFLNSPLWGHEEDTKVYVGNYANFNLDYAKKYLLSGSIRYDQSNLFGNSKEYRGKPLWSVGLGWNAHEEEFLTGVEWLNKLKVRSSFGKNGSISNNSSPYMIARSDYWNDAKESVLVPKSPANDKLTWETTETLNLGMDFSLFNNRLTGSVDYYNRKSLDLLGSKKIDPTNGWTTATVNYASIENKGFEFSLQGIIIKDMYGFNLLSGISYSNNKNEVTESISTALTANQYIGQPQLVGKPISGFYAYRYGKLDNEGKYYLKNEEGEYIDATTKPKGLDLVEYVGPRSAPVFGSFFIRPSFKNFSLNAYFTYQFGGYNWRELRSPELYTGHNNVSVEFKDRWQKEGDEETAYIPRFNGYEWYKVRNYFNKSTKMAQSTDYIKLNNITLDYRFNPELVEKVGLKGASLSAQVNNVWFWAKNPAKRDPSAGLNMPKSPRSYMLKLKMNF